MNEWRRWEEAFPNASDIDKEYHEHIIMFGDIELELDELSSEERDKLICMGNTHDFLIKALGIIKGLLESTEQYPQTQERIIIAAVCECDRALEIASQGRLPQIPHYDFQELVRCGMVPGWEEEGGCRQ